MLPSILLNSLINSVFLFKEHLVHSNVLCNYLQCCLILCLLPERKAHEGRDVWLFHDYPVRIMPLEFDVFFQFGKLSASIFFQYCWSPVLSFPSRTPVAHMLNLSLFYVSQAPFCSFHSLRALV